MNRSYTCACCQNGCGPTIEAHLNGDCVSRSSTHECNFAGYGFRVGLHRDLNLKVTRCFHLRVPCMVLICFANRVERISHMYFLDVLFGGTCYHGCLLFAASALNFQAFSLNAPRGQVVGSYGMEKKNKTACKNMKVEWIVDEVFSAIDTTMKFYTSAFSAYAPETCCICFIIYCLLIVKLYLP